MASKNKGRRVGRMSWEVETRVEAGSGDTALVDEKGDGQRKPGDHSKARGGLSYDRRMLSRKCGTCERMKGVRNKR